jgi:ribonuclease VapC
MMKKDCLVIVDRSALIALLCGEPEAAAFARAIESSAVRRPSAANFVEAASLSIQAATPSPADASMIFSKRRA